MDDIASIIVFKLLGEINVCEITLEENLRSL